MRVKVVRWGKAKARVRIFLNMYDFISYMEASYLMMNLGYVDRITVEAKQ